MAVTGKIPTLIDLSRSRERADRFVGRVEELAMLRSPWPPVSIIFGEPGGGKTRLLGEAAIQARVSAVNITCFPSAATIPLEALLAVVRELRGARAKHEKWERPNEALRLTAIRDFLEREAAGGLLVQIDDLQWADVNTLDALAYLADRLRDFPVRWHLAARIGDDRCETFAIRLTQTRLGHVIRLREFGIADFRAFVAATCDHSVDEAAIGELYSLSGGNPLYAEQLIVAAAAGESTHSPGLSGLLAERIRSLSEQQLMVARALAIDGEAISPAILSKASGLHRDALASVVGELETAFIAKTSVRGVQFRHDLLRRACYSWMPDAERARLHALMAKLVGDPWRRVQHLDGAHQMEGAARTLLAHGLLMVYRADRAEATAALEGAYERSLDYPAVRGEAQAGLAALLAYSGDLENAVGLMQEVEAAGALPHAVRVAVRCLFAEAAFEGSDETSISTEFLRQTIADAREVAPEYLPRLLTVAGAVADRSGDSSAALELLEIGLESCSPSTPIRDRIRLLSWRGVVRGRLGNPDVGLREAEDAARVAATHGLSAEFADACIKCCYLCDLCGDREAYEAWCRRGLDYAGAKFPRTTAILRLNLATAVQDRGALEEALALDAAAYEESRDSNPTLRVQIACSLALANAMLGRFGDASSLVADLERTNLSERWRRAVCFVAGRVFEMHGDLEIALRRYQVVSSFWVGVREPEGFDVRAKAGEARVLYQLGRFDELTAVWEFSRQGFERGWPLGASLRAEIEGYALIAGGRVAEGTVSLLEAARTSKERFRAAYLKATAGLAKADRDLINTAICELDEMGAQIASESIRRKALGIGLRPRHRPRSKLAVTGSDVRIASLIRAGKTNAEIGVQLGLSTKTVEHYVSNMLAKLGLRSRAQLAATIGSDAE